MNKLSKQHLKDRDEVITKLREARDTLQIAVDNFNEVQGNGYAKLLTALDTYNDDVIEAWDRVATAIEEYNEGALTAANEWKDAIASEIDDYVSERSDAWHDSEKAELISAWRENFDQDLPTVEIEQPEAIEIDEPDELQIDLDGDAAEVVEQIPEVAE